MSKLDKGVVLYFSAHSIGRAKGARCGACWKFVKTGACVEVEGTIKPEKVCGLYIHGAPFAKDPGFDITKVSQQESGYGDGDTHCVSCKYMGNRARKFSPCEEVEGTIEQEGCCNAHERLGTSRFAKSMKEEK